MSVQESLRIAGAVLLVASAVFAAAAVYAFRALDIRGAKEDLAGRRRGEPAGHGVKGRGRACRREAGRASGLSLLVWFRGSSEQPSLFAPPSTSGLEGSDEATQDLSTRVGASVQGGVCGRGSTLVLEHVSRPTGTAEAPPIEFRITRRLIFAAGEQTIEE